MDVILRGLRGFFRSLIVRATCGGCLVSTTWTVTSRTVNCYPLGFCRQCFVFTTCV
jgi:hypothetical protein